MRILTCIALFFLSIKYGVAQLDLQPIYPTNKVVCGKSFDASSPYGDHFHWDYFPELRNPLVAMRKIEEERIFQNTMSRATGTEKKTTDDKNDWKNNKNQQLLDILNEADEKESTVPQTDYSNNPEFVEQSIPYQKALASVQAMLQGKRPLSVKDALYQTEAAYGNPYLSYTEYSNNIARSAQFIRSWMKQNKLDLKNNEAKHYAIQRFMKDTLTTPLYSPDFKKSIANASHIPFRYDYTDYQAIEDFRNYFVSKCLATGYGQCSSLPGVYLCLAEALGAKVYLSFAPLHSMVKYQDNAGYIHTYEPTSHWNISDKWYEDYFRISTEAKRSGIYLDTLNTRQIVADCAIDLANGYIKKIGVVDGVFVQQCLETAKAEFPRGNNIHAHLTYSRALARLLTLKLRAAGLTSLDEAEKEPATASLLEKLKKNEETILRLGYDMTEQRYQQMVRENDKLGKTQNSQVVTTKDKRNLFITK